MNFMSYIYCDHEIFYLYIIFYLFIRERIYSIIYYIYTYATGLPAIPHKKRID